MDWFARFSKPILFVVIALLAMGAFLGVHDPHGRISVHEFPPHHHRRRQRSDADRPDDGHHHAADRRAVNSVPGLQQVRSITSRGSAEIDLFFNWNVDMVTDAATGGCGARRNSPHTLPPTAKIETHRLTFASFPIIGYSLTSDTVPQTQLWAMATYELKPRLNRLDGVATVLVQGGQEPEFHIMPDPAKLLAAGVTVTDILDAVRRTNLIDSPGLLEQNHQLYLGLVRRAGARSGADRRHRREVPRRPGFRCGSRMLPRSRLA